VKPDELPDQPIIVGRKLPSDSATKKDSGQPLFAHHYSGQPAERHAQQEACPDAQLPSREPMGSHPARDCREPESRLKDSPPHRDEHTRRH